MLMKPVKGIGGEFFSLAGASHQAQQNLYQPGVVFQKQFLEVGVRSRFGGEPGCHPRGVPGHDVRFRAKKQCLVIWLHNH
jgi:hypothetical protein